MQSEALPIISSSCPKDESNAAFPVRIGLVFYKKSSSFLLCANSTYHVSFCEHPYINKTTFPSFSCVKRRRSGLNRISHSAAKSNCVGSGSRKSYRGSWNVRFSPRSYRCKKLPKILQLPPHLRLSFDKKGRPASPISYLRRSASLASTWRGALINITTSSSITFITLPCLQAKSNNWRRQIITDDRGDQRRKSHSHISHCFRQLTLT